ncbi:hypothetical protein PG997_008759 [Apiospora hydei]|uniref:Tat pathway signal sequence n=1 Tax=Apiospora hydei TaxID=1337664 RepID=A0ABR1WBQ1_9PEZI
MTDPRDSSSAHSMADDDEQPSTGLLGGGSLRRGERNRILLALILIATRLAYLKSETSQKALEGSTWSPIQQFVQYEVKDRGGHSLDAVRTYAGVPTPENDKAWDALIRPAYFNATVEELERAGESLDNVTRLTGGGYLASIGVYHELHCVRQLRFYIYKDRYYPNLSESEEKYLQFHLDHCVESLREAIMCYGNTALISFYWDDPKASQPAAQSNARAKCAVWDSIEHWGYSRRVPTSPDFQRPPMNEEQHM